MTNCAHCGSTNAPDAGYCEKCGQPLATAAMGATAAVVAAPVPAVAVAARTNSLAVASLLLSFFSLFPLIGILAVVLGHVARSQIRKSAGKLKGAGIALAGLVLGYAGLGLFLLVLLSSLPDLVWRHGHGREMNEASAVGSLRTINTAQVTYFAEYPTRGYSATLAQLGPPASNLQPGPEAAFFIDSVLASGQKSGYRFTYVAGPADEHGLIMAYTVRADPLAPESGERSFFTDETGVIRFENGKPAGPDSPVVE